MIIFLKILLILISIFIINFDYYYLFKFHQLSGYNLIKTFKSINLKQYYPKLILLIFINISLIFTNNFFIIFAVIIFFLVIVLILNLLQKTKQKNKLVFTKRFTRLFILTNLFSIFYLVFISFIVKNPYIFKYFLLNFYLIFLFIFVFSQTILYPIEFLIKQFYKDKAKNKLKKLKNLKVVAITGSFAKTSVKNILYEMLKTKYKVKKTEKSFNTEMGITKVILNNVEKSDQILILEFGADHNHDIKKLCKIASPDYAIITGVNDQHLKTFKTFENIKNTKYELVENLKPQGKIVFNKDNIVSYEFYNKCSNKHKYLVTTSENNQKTSLWAEKIKCKFNETTFYLCTKKEKCFCKTILLGKNNVQNILLAAKMALILGVKLKDIQKVIEKLSPTPHRLNLIENNGKFILDDSFNANPDGVKGAIDVLKTFKGKKIVITPGLVELGEKQYTENIKLGKYLKKIDYVLITNDINRKAILEGLKGSKNDIFCFDNLFKATKKLSEIFNIGDCVLFLNDLPDNY